VNLKDSHSGSMGEKLKKALEKKVNR
jgi:hypothetical protein